MEAQSGSHVSLGPNGIPDGPNVITRVQMEPKGSKCEPRGVGGRPTPSPAMAKELVVPSPGVGVGRPFYTTTFGPEKRCETKTTIIKHGFRNGAQNYQKSMRTKVGKWCFETGHDEGDGCPQTTLDRISTEQDLSLTRPIHTTYIFGTYV